MSGISSALQARITYAFAQFVSHGCSAKLVLAHQFPHFCRHFRCVRLITDTAPVPYNSKYSRHSRADRSDCTACKYSSSCVHYRSPCMAASSCDQSAEFTECEHVSYNSSSLRQKHLWSATTHVSNIPASLSCRLT